MCVWCLWHLPPWRIDSHKQRRENSAIFDVAFQFEAFRETDSVAWLPITQSNFSMHTFLKVVLSKVTLRKLTLFPHASNSAHCNSLRKWCIRKVCGENLDNSLVLKNQPSLRRYLKSSKAKPCSRSTIHYKLLRRPLSRDILVIWLWSVILRRRIASWTDSKASFKPRTDVPMGRGTIFCTTGLDLCKGRRNSVNSFDQITHTPRAVTCVATDTPKNVWKLQNRT